MTRFQLRKAINHGHAAEKGRLCLNKRGKRVEAGFRLRQVLLGFLQRNRKLAVQKKQKQ